MSVTGKKVLWQGRFLRGVLISYKDGRCGTVRLWESVERVGCDGVVGIVPITDDNEVVLIRQFRPPVNTHVIELPAGLCDPGETMEGAARRELIEETGYKAGAMRFLISGPMSSGASSEILTVFVATGLTFVGVGRRDETEDIEVLKAPLASLDKSLKKFMRKGDCIDLKVHGLIAMAGTFVRDRGRA